MLNQSKKRFFVTLMIISKHSTKEYHANMLVFDNKNGVGGHFLRLDPNGADPDYYDPSLLDTKLRQWAFKINRSYVRQNDFSFGLQRMQCSQSNKYIHPEKRGYCIYWSLFLIDAMITHQKSYFHIDVLSKKLEKEFENVDMTQFIADYEQVIARLYVGMGQADEDLCNYIADKLRVQ